MIELLFSRAPRVLHIRYGVDLTPANLAALDTRVAEFVEREGTADSIVDFSSVPRTDFPTSVIEESARAAPRMTDRRRIYVAGSLAMFGVCRLYSLYQEARGFDPPLVVHTLAEALASLEAGDAFFAPWAPAGAPAATASDAARACAG